MDAFELDDGVEPEQLTTIKLENILQRLESLNDIEIGGEYDFILSLYQQESVELDLSGIAWTRLSIPLYFRPEIDSVQYVEGLIRRVSKQKRRAHKGRKYFLIAPEIKKIEGTLGGNAKAKTTKAIHDHAVALAKERAPAGGWKSAPEAAEAIMADVDTFARARGRRIASRKIEEWLRAAGIKRH